MMIAAIKHESLLSRNAKDLVRNIVRIIGNKGLFSKLFNGIVGGIIRKKIIKNVNVNF